MARPLLNNGGMRDLKQIRITNPCHENWDAMSGETRSRLCERCETRVVNLSSMTPSEVDELGASSDEGFCVRFVARAEGMPILRSLPRRSFLRRLASMVAIAIPALASACRDDPEEEIDPDEVARCQTFMGFLE